MSIISSNQNFPTKNQIPDHSIMDHFKKQTYLGNEYIYSASTAIGGTSEVPLLYLANPAGSAKSLFYGMRKLICATASNSAIARFYLNPVSITGGSTETPINLRVASSNESIATLTLSPSVGGSFGSLIDILSSLNPSPDESNTLIILDPGESLLITSQCSASSTVITKNSWYEL